VETHRRPWPCPPTARFNGATPSQTWKPLDVGLEDIAFDKLQWSHAFSDVETTISGDALVRILSLQWSHAFSDVETLRRIDLAATASGLQWSHAFSDVETWHA